MAFDPLVLLGVGKGYRAVDLSLCVLERMKEDCPSGPFDRKPRASECCRHESIFRWTSQRLREESGLRITTSGFRTLLSFAAGEEVGRIRLFCRKQLAAQTKKKKKKEPGFPQVCSRATFFWDELISFLPVLRPCMAFSQAWWLMASFLTVLSPLHPTGPWVTWVLY